jgi:hypothetical protein
MSSEVFDGVLLLFFLPEGEVLLEELDDGLGVSEGLFIDVIDLLESIGESGLTTEKLRANPNLIGLQAFKLWEVV